MLRTDDKQKFNTMELRSLNDWVVKLLLMPIDGKIFGQVNQTYQIIFVNRTTFIRHWF
jgi:hypothetical protein